MTLSDSETSLSIAESASSTVCRICHSEGQEDSPLLSPCICSGTLGHVHQQCLQQWIKSAEITKCELCKFPYVMQIKTKPFLKWDWMQLQRGQNMKLLISITTNFMVLTGMVFSIYVFISRLHDDLEGNRRLDWHTWIKLAMVALSVMGGSMFIYMQSQLYIILFRKWKTYNKVIYIQDKPEKLPLLDDIANDYELHNETKNNSEMLPLGILSHAPDVVTAEDVSISSKISATVKNKVENDASRSIDVAADLPALSIPNVSINNMTSKNGKPVSEEMSLCQNMVSSMSPTESNCVSQLEDSISSLAITKSGEINVPT